jgi:hypothetical protein
MTLLEAVNEMLEGLGESPVTALETGQATDAGQAESILGSENKKIQGEGWAANTIPEKIYTPSGGEITLTSVLRCKPVAGSADLRVTIRNGKLYDLETESSSGWGTDTVTLEAVILVAFEQLPQRLAEYIAASAAMRYQVFKKRGQFDSSLMEIERIRRRAEAIREDITMRGRYANFLMDSQSIALKGDRLEYEEE